jgi:hypothetical protein
MTRTAAPQPAASKRRRRPARARAPRSQKHPIEWETVKAKAVEHGAVIRNDRIHFVDDTEAGRFLISWEVMLDAARVQIGDLKLSDLNPLQGHRIMLGL